MARPDQPAEVALLLHPQVQMAAVHGLTDLFAFADDLARKPPGAAGPLIRLSHYSLAEDGGVRRGFDSAPGPDGEPLIVIVPPCHAPPTRDASTERLADWLRGREAAGATLAAVCGGTFLLAETGLLDGRRATTHWAFANALADRFPAVTVDTDPLVIDHGRVLTAGGMMAWMDLGLTLVERLLGPAAMVETARFMMIDPPSREQRYYSAFSPRLDHGDDPILKVQQHLRTPEAQGLPVTALARLAGLEERTFTRRFAKATGLKPNAYQQHLRIERARALLESASLNVDKVAWDVGYSDPASFRRVFARITGLAPGVYRQRFGRAGA